VAENDTRGRLTERAVKQKMAARSAPWAKDPVFQSEFKRWNKILADSGLDDIESHPATKGGDPTNTPFLKRHYLESRKKYLRGVHTGNAEFFRLVGEWTGQARFRSLRERWAWGLMSAGVSQRAAATKYRVPVGRMAKQIGLMLAAARVVVREESASDEGLSWDEQIDALIDAEDE
jgi:hypothetical protein